MALASALRNNYKLNPPKLKPSSKPNAPETNPSKASVFHLDTEKKKELARLPHLLLSKPSLDLRNAPNISDVQNSNALLTPAEIKRLGARFKKLDSDNSGSVSLVEFLRIPEISRNVLANRIVEIFDTDGNGEVDFREFVLSMSQFSISGNLEGRLRCAFRIYDIDKDGFISNGELFQVIKAMVGGNMTDIQVQQIVDHTFVIGNVKREGQFSFEEFAALVKNNRSIRTEAFLRGIV